MINEVEQIVTRFRDCFSREASFHWFVIVVFALMVRVDHHGVTSIIRWLVLDPTHYNTLLWFFRAGSWAVEDVARALGMPSYLVLDAFYAANTLFERVAPVVDAQQQRWAHVIVKGKRSYVGYREVPPVTGKRPVGRPPEYGENRNWSSGCTPPGSRSKAH